MSLKISNDVSLPRAIAARTIFIAGTKGSGKSYTAGVLVEEMLKANIHLVVLDPLGVFWGLRHDADGGPGGFPIIILGGEHADVPLLSTSGETVAEFIVRSGQSCILDMSGFDSDAEQDRFVTDLLKKLFRLKASNKDSIHLVMDEADMFVPQYPQKNQMALLGAAKTIVTKARSRGLSMTMITQRPQSIHKAASDEADVVFCHRITGPKSADAMRYWIEQHADRADAKSFMDMLPALENGECYIWSPQFLKMFKRVKIRAKTTFDSSRTPDPGERTKKPKEAAAIDLAKLTTEIKASAEAAKKNDPKELHRTIAELEKKLKAQPKPLPATKPQVKTIEKHVLKDGQIKRVETIVERIGKELDRAIGMVEKIRAPATELRDAMNLAKTPSPVMRQPVVHQRPQAAPVEPRAAKPRSASPESNGKLPIGEKAVLTACAQFPTGLERGQLSVLTGYKRSSRDAYISRLREKGYVDLEGDMVIPMDIGILALGPSFEPLPTGDELRRYWFDRLPIGERAIFEQLIAAYPNAVDRESLDEATGYKRSSRDAYISRMQAKQIVEVAGPKKVKASKDLFD